MQRYLIMNIKCVSTHESLISCDVLVLPVTENKPVHPYAKLDKSLDGLLSQVAAEGDCTGGRSEITLLHTRKKIRPHRVLLIGLGKTAELTRDRLREAGGKACSYLRGMKIGSVALSTHLVSSLNLPPADLMEGYLLALYRFDKYRKDDSKKTEVKNITVLSGRDRQIRDTKAIANAVWFARDLVNTPSNDMPPSELARAARSLKDVSVRVIGRKQAEKLGMGAYLSVAKGSNSAPKFIVISYRKRKAAPVALIGKSITFDSGGISLKPAKGMEKMKHDMAGGAAVLGVMKAVSELNLPLHVISVLPAAENLPGGSASKPGDVVKTINGRTIEIISTDAEGRLAVADAIGYARRFRPSAIIDIATLTGACSIAFGAEAIAMFGNDQGLMEKMKKASDQSGERVWQMPLLEEYREYVKSDIADLKNSAGSSGSLASSGYFLSTFAGDTPWIHLDIAGTAWTDKDRPYIPKGATGVGVRLLMQFLLQSS